jgi:endonuclease-3
MRKRDTATKHPAAKILDSARSAPGTKLNTPKTGRATDPQGARQMPSDPARVAEIFRRFEAANPHPKGELDYANAFTLLVAVVLSAQATDLGVNKATPALFAAADSPAKMAELGEEKLQDMIKTIGLYRTKAKNVVALSRRLVKDFGGEVPHSREALETLPGVGRKTANVVMNTAFGAPVIAVDTHIFRVSNRIPLAAGKTPLEVERGLEKIIPAAFKRHAHHWLILHGRYICKARRPACERCLISDLCRWPDKRV